MNVLQLSNVPKSPLRLENLAQSRQQQDENTPRASRLVPADSSLFPITAPRVED